MRGRVFTALLWGLALLGAAGAVFRLLPHPRPPMEEVEFTFSLGSIPEALAKGAASLLGEGRAAGKECRVTEVGTVPVLRPRGGREARAVSLSLLSALFLGLSDDLFYDRRLFLWVLWLMGLGLFLKRKEEHV